MNCGEREEKDWRGWSSWQFGCRSRPERLCHSDVMEQEYSRAWALGVGAGRRSVASFPSLLLLFESEIAFTLAIRGLINTAQ